MAAMLDGPTAEEIEAREFRRRLVLRIVGWTLGGVAFVVVVLGCWIGIRGILAKQQLEAAGNIATELREGLSSGSLDDAADLANELALHASKAADLTSDPIWQGLESVPGIGPNLTVVHGLSEILTDVANDAIIPLAEAGSALGPKTFLPVDGHIDIAAIAGLAGPADQASAALDVAVTRLDALPVSATIPIVADAAGRLRSALAPTAPAVAALATAAKLFPTMHGETAPRDYLLLVQNNAEPRATGGIPGAIAVLHVDKGGITLEDQTSAVALGGLATPSTTVDDATSLLYGNVTQRFQQVTAMPYFPLTGRLAQAQWYAHTGGIVTGVVSIDPVALGYLLNATGAVQLPDGTKLTGDNAAETLLNKAYFTYANPADQDAFFAQTAKVVFDSLTKGSAHPAEFLQALVEGVGDRRILLWSDVDAEEDALQGSGIAGLLPTSDASTARFGIYINDSTGSKMGWYLETRTTFETPTCVGSDRSELPMTIELTNDAPSDAATSLPASITGAGAFGVPAGDYKFLVAIYPPEGLGINSVKLDGKEIPFVGAVDQGRQAIEVSLTLHPQQQSVLSLSWDAPADIAATIDAVQTPSVNSASILPAAGNCL